MIKLLDGESSKTAHVLAAFLGEVLKDELKGTGITGEIRRSPIADGYELRLSHHYYGVLTLSDLECDKPRFLEMYQYEAIELVRSLREGLRRCADQRYDDGQ
jgi:hypothetical protein